MKWNQLTAPNSIFAGRADLSATDTEIRVQSASDAPVRHYYQSNWPRMRGRTSESDGYGYPNVKRSAHITVRRFPNSRKLRNVGL